MVAVPPTCEKPFASAPRKPRSSTHRTSSRAARSGSCIGSAARPANRSGCFAICAARWSLARRATSSARFESGSPGWLARVEREDHQGDAVAIHLGQAQVRDIHDPAAQLGPGVVRQIAPGIDERVVRSEVLLESDLAVHDVFTTPFARRRARKAGVRDTAARKKRPFVRRRLA
jgi:hypothetical protein